MTQITDDLFQHCKTFSMGVETMLNCAVPGCSASEVTLHSGRLHLIDTPIEATTMEAGSPRSRMKYVWLCAACSETHVVQTWRAAGEQIRCKVQRPVLAFPAQPFPVQSETAEPRRLKLVANAS